MRTFGLLSVLLLSPVVPLQAQSDSGVGTIQASGNGLVELEADYASLVLGVQVEGPSPDSAAIWMTRRLERVTDSLVSLGIERDSLPTSRLDVRPRTANVGGSRVTTYQASSLVRLRVWDLGRVSEILSAAILSGATTIENLDYRSTEEREGRDEALRLATEEANREARIMAEAQGMQLYRLVSASSSRSSVGFDRNLVGLQPIMIRASRFQDSPIPASIIPIGVSVSVQVSVEWEVR